MNQIATVSEMGMLPALQGTPSLDINKNTLMAMRDGRPGIALLTEAVRLMRGTGKLTVPEYLYYRLWDRSLSLEDKRAFVGKKAQHLMHLACNDRHWYRWRRGCGGIVGWRSLRFVQRTTTGVSAPTETTPWKSIARRRTGLAAGYFLGRPGLIR
jgi:hypothetical protein